MSHGQRITGTVWASENRWIAYLACGHERWFTQRSKPNRKTICCPHGCSTYGDGRGHSRPAQVNEPK